MDIRKATVEDIPALSKLLAEVQQLHADNEPGLFIEPVNDEFGVAFFEQIMAEPNNYVFLAEVDGEAAGYIFLELEARPATMFNKAYRFLSIEHIGVNEKFRRQGVGRALMAQVKQVAVQEQVDEVVLSTWGFNTAAHRFFESQGFEMLLMRMRVKK